MREATVLLMLLVSSACEHGIEFVEPLPFDSAGGGGPGTIARATLAVTVEVATEDRQITAALGLTGEGLAGAKVTIRRLGEATPVTGVADALGKAVFNGLLPGSYTIAADRVLTAEEMRRVAEVDSSLADVNAFGAAGFTEVTPPAHSVSIRAVAGRRGSLVFSEMNHHAVYLGGSFFYTSNGYVELYNNSDSTIYLDGKIFARALYFPWEVPQRPCSTVDPWRLDPRGVWSDMYVAIPGNGRQYPLPAGRAAVLAMEAIDHRVAHADLPDLSRADFEYVGPSEVDNPQVPNLIDRGAYAWIDPIGRGFFFSGTKEVLVLANALDPGTATRETIQLVLPRDHDLIPANKILDVIAMTSAEGVPGQPFCSRLIHESFDAQHGILLDFRSPLSISRRVLTRLPDGRIVLQRTKTSSRDFERRAGTPGSTP